MRIISLYLFRIAIQQKTKPATQTTQIIRAHSSILPIKTPASRETKKKSRTRNSREKKKTRESKSRHLPRQILHKTKLRTYIDFPRTGARGEGEREISRPDTDSLDRIQHRVINWSKMYVCARRGARESKAAPFPAQERENPREKKSPSLPVITERRGKLEAQPGGEGGGGAIRTHTSSVKSNYRTKNK